MTDADGDGLSDTVELARLRLESQRKIERNTFWTMLAVAAHTGLGVASAIPAPVKDALQTDAQAVIFLFRAFFGV